ncbi:hypothetical protein ACJRO7_031967 [Eucalyptus globulus]|uniref:Retrotransposon gag domain-containing protein n=1 Tax=Eucalyptus globulus TaxID=34317 RepID=A0ABD3JI28_EUCGL
MEKKYLQWSQIVRTFLKGNGKLSHLEGIGLGQGDAKFPTWDEEDSSIMSWLWSSMQPKISKNYMFLPTAKDIWEAVHQSYLKLQDATIIYELKTKASTTKQGNHSVMEYYNLMRGLWLEIDHNLNIHMRSEKKADRTIMLEGQHTEGSAMKAIKEETNPYKNKRLDPIKTMSSEGLWCSFCKKPHHTRENCFKLYGRTEVEAASMDQYKPIDDEIFDKEEVGKIKALLDSLSKSSDICSLDDWIC